MEDKRKEDKAEGFTELAQSVENIEDIEVLEGGEVSADTKELSERLKAAEAQVAEAALKYQRTLAEFDNFRKRTVKEKALAYSDGAYDIIKTLMPVVDSFERAFQSDTDTESPAYKGMALIHKQLLSFMEQNGITEIPAVGEVFNPGLHDAIAHVDDERYGENEIIEELQKGYVFKDRIIRHSMVKVAN